MSEVLTKTCEQCQSVITPQQIVQRQAGLVQGVLLCPACVEAKRQAVVQAQKAAQESLNLEEDYQPPPADAPSKIRSFATGSTLAGAHDDGHRKRALTGVAAPATRCRTFHGKLTPAALAHMDEQINEWLDANPEVYIKHATSSVGPFEAKHVEQHLIVTVFY